MGVNISELLPKKEIKFDDLNNKVIAIDAFNALYQFLSSIRQLDGSPLMDSEGNVTSHLQGLFSRSLNLLNRGIKIVYVFDGKAPLLKEKERNLRKEQRLKGYKKYIEAIEKKNIEEMQKYAKTTSRLTQVMIEESKDLIKALGLPIIEAPSEAEAQAACLCNSITGCRFLVVWFSYINKKFNIVSKKKNCLWKNSLYIFRRNKIGRDIKKFRN